MQQFQLILQYSTAPCKVQKNHYSGLCYLLSRSLGWLFPSMHFSINSASRVFKMSVQYSILLCSVTIIREATFTLKHKIITSVFCPSSFSLLHVPRFKILHQSLTYRETVRRRLRQTSKHTTRCHVPSALEDLLNPP